MNALKLELVTRGILERTKLDHKKAHRLALAAMTGRVCPMCDDLGIVESSAIGASASAGGVVIGLHVACPVCVSVEEARQ